MSRDTVEVLEERLGRSEDGQAAPDALAERLASVERAYAELCQRLSRYERERREIKTRIERILLRIDTRERA